MYRFIRYLFWQLYYLPQQRPRELNDYLIRGGRCRWPWRKFRPGVYHNDDGNQWEVWFADEQAYTIPNVILKVEASVSMDTHEVVGLTIWDESLKACVLVETERHKPLPGEPNQE